MGALRGDPRRRVPRGLACHSQAPLARSRVGSVTARGSSPGPESNRILPFTRRVLDHSSFMGDEGMKRRIARGARGDAPARAGSAAPAEGIEPSSSRLTAGCLTIRRRWNVSLDAHEHAAADSACPSSRGRRNEKAVSTHVRVERIVGAEFSENEVRMQTHTDIDPGTGFEPVFLGPEPSVLPLDDPGTSRSGGTRTLNTPGKSRVRSPLRHGPACTSRNGGTRGIRTLTSRVKSPVLDRSS